MTTATDFISLAAASSNAATTASAKKTTTSALSNEQFKSVFLAELKNQNPLEPMDNKDMMNQMVQLNMLNEITSLNTTLQAFAKTNQMVNSAALIGKQVQAQSPDGTLYEDVVKSLAISGNVIQLQLADGSDISLDWLTGVEAASTGAVTGA
jgi:flagellar basal-body rod modification protein FlgD